MAISNTSSSSINHKKEILSDSEIGYYSLCFKNINLNDYNLLYYNLLDVSLLKENDTPEKFIYRCLLNIFKETRKADLIKSRFTLDFFTIQEIKNIVSNYTLIDPNNLSKK